MRRKSATSSNVMKGFGAAASRTFISPQLPQRPTRRNRQRNPENVPVCSGPSGGYYAYGPFGGIGIGGVNVTFHRAVADFEADVTGLVALLP